MALTVRQVNGASEPGRYGDGHGLYLEVTSPTNRCWLFRYERGGRERWMGLGPLHTVTLADARERARQARLRLLDGVDPIDAREARKAEQAKATAKQITFGDAVQQYFALQQKAWQSAKHRSQFLASMKKYALPKIGKLPVAAIDTGLVLKVIEPIWLTKTTTADRVRSRIESVLEWATVRGYRDGENPARWKGHLRAALPARGQIAKVQHHKALPFEDTPEFLVALGKRAGIAARAFEFLILTAARTSEVTGARWSEIDLEAKLWTLSTGRMKARKEHRVPLSDRAVALLQALPREADYVFPGARKGAPLSAIALRGLQLRMGRTDITIHGFRSTFRDWAAERTKYPNHVVEMALAHAIGNKVEAAYRRGDLLAQRVHLMADWATFCSTPKRDATVTPIRGRA